MEDTYVEAASDNRAPLASTTDLPRACYAKRRRSRERRLLTSHRPGLRPRSRAAAVATVLPPIVAIFACVSDVFATVATVLTPVQPILSSVETILDPVREPTVVAPVAAIFRPVADVLASVPPVFSPVAHVLPPVAAILATIDTVLDTITHEARAVSRGILCFCRGARDEHRRGGQGKQLEVHSHKWVLLRSPSLW